MDLASGDVTLTMKVHNNRQGDNRGMKVEDGVIELASGKRALFIYFQAERSNRLWPCLTRII